MALLILTYWGAIDTYQKEKAGQDTTAQEPTGGRLGYSFGGPYMVKLEGELYYSRGYPSTPGMEDKPDYGIQLGNPFLNVETDDPDEYFAEYGYEYYGQVSELVDAVPEEDFQASLSDAGTRIYTNPDDPGRFFLFENNSLCVYKTIDDQDQGVFENSFPPSARPTLRDLWLQFSQRSPLRLLHWNQISHKL